jgi:hypothetical protein
MAILVYDWREYGENESSIICCANVNHSGADSCS